MHEEKVHDKATDPAGEKETVKDTLGDLGTHGADYLNTLYRLQVLKLARKATDVTANLAGGIVSAILGLFFLFFGGMALGFWLGEMLNSYALGFLIVAIFFVIAAVIFMSIRKKLVFPIWRNKIIRKLYE